MGAPLGFMLPPPPLTSRRVDESLLRCPCQELTTTCSREDRPGRRCARQFLTKAGLRGRDRFRILGKPVRPDSWIGALMCVAFQLTFYLHVTVFSLFMTRLLHAQRGCEA